jgi:hypothetical protein
MAEPDPVGSLSKVAIKLPRMSFEITGLTIDDSVKVSRVNTYQIPLADGGTGIVRAGVPYHVSMQLNIMAKNQGDALQILEQIIPYFVPDYTVSVKDLDGTQQKTDLPIVLQNVSLQDDYEGDAMSRRTIIYTLDFDLRVKFYGAVNTTGAGIIRTTNVTFIDTVDGNKRLETVSVGVVNPTATDATTVTVDSNVFMTDVTNYALTLSGIVGTFQDGEEVYSTLTGTVGTLNSISGSTCSVTAADGFYTTEEFLVGRTSKAYGSITGVSK